jgi:hypothetical protein
MASLRQIAACLGLPPAFSLLHDFFGHLVRPTSFNPSLSVLAQVRLVKGKHLHLNLIRVNSTPSGFSADKEAEIADSLCEMRELYAQVNLGVGRVNHWIIPEEEAGEFTRIDSDCEAEDLTSGWSVLNDAHDVFLVSNGWSSETPGHETAGVSSEDGECDKDAKGFSGSVVSLAGVFVVTGRLLAHEVGHYLGLEHIDGLDMDDVLEGNFTPGQQANVMFPSNFGNQLNAEQAATMKQHCLVRAGC